MSGHEKWEVTNEGRHGFALRIQGDAVADFPSDLEVVARLVAAKMNTHAELLEALKDAYKLMDGWHGRPEWKAEIIANAKAAISKAESL